MNVKPISDQPASDDQELAKVLAGVDKQVSEMPTPAASDSAQSDDSGNTKGPSGLEFEETAAPAADAAAEAPASDDASKADDQPAPTTEPAPAAAPAPAENAASAAPQVALTGNPELDTIKKDALSELRPLVTKLDLPADEKFDTILLIIRSTDDQSLLGAAHEAAKSIEDETKRAEALLDVIKEIDYFGNQGAPAA